MGAKRVLDRTDHMLRDMELSEGMNESRDGIRDGMRETRSKLCQSLGGMEKMSRV